MDSPYNDGAVYPLLDWSDRVTLFIVAAFWIFSFAWSNLPTAVSYLGDSAIRRTARHKTDNTPATIPWSIYQL